MDPHPSFQQRIWQIVAAIPPGKVAIYGDIARLAGSPRAARQVGGVLRRLPPGSTPPSIACLTGTALSHCGEMICCGSGMRWRRKA
ncbi:Methylated-DNA--protein-cysteine methyltransferase|nr:Methylated-DNA--protein-cysteine methyltransferase [Candidatus Pantoea persica]